MLAGTMKVVAAAAALCEGRDDLVDLQERWSTLEVPPRMTEALEEAVRAAKDAAQQGNALSDMALALAGQHVAGC